MKNSIMTLALLATLTGCTSQNKEEITHEVNSLRAPAYPLVTIDPYTSAWSMQNHLYDGPVCHWTGKSFPLLGVLTVDGETYRFLGKEEPKFTTLIPHSETEEWEGKYTFSQPAEGWQQPTFDDRLWKQGSAAFGTRENEHTARTQWGTQDIWVRRTVQLDEEVNEKSLYLDYTHDDDVEIYINGMKIVDTGNACKKHARIELNEEVKATLKKGENVIAAHCRNRQGNALLDFGLMEEQKDGIRFGLTAQQLSADVQATQTHYAFQCGPVKLDLTFTAPLLLDNLDLATRPVNYLSYHTESVDGRVHQVELRLEASPQWALDVPGQKSVSEQLTMDGLTGMRTGSQSQQVLGKRGDDVRIDWGYFYLTAPTTEGIGTAIENDQLVMTRQLGRHKEADGYVMLAYDDLYSIQYFGQNLRPYWNRTGQENIESQLQQAARQYGQVMEQCRRFDRQLLEDATRAGGRRYAELCLLAYRQSVAAHKLVQTPEGKLLFFSKENFSNGSIGTVDVTYPSAPLYLLYNPELLKGMLNPIFDYAESGRWNKPFAAHDVGTYPLANGQTYGGDMPVEENGNMLILCAALAAVEGNADYARQHWQTLTTWVEYLEQYGLDPANQLCTDDFAGHFAHNANLSIKAILAIASYGYLAQLQGRQETADNYLTKAREMAAQWCQMADDGDHYRLTFDQPGSWSQKYNLVWDDMLQLNLFPAEVAQKELAYYLTRMNRYGLPLDNRETYTKTDWVMWTATMAQDTQTFQALIDPIHRMMNETESRVPMSDWMYTDSGRQRGFQARSVVGGYFIKLLADKLKADR